MWTEGEAVEPYHTDGQRDRQWNLGRHMDRGKDSGALTHRWTEGQTVEPRQTYGQRERQWNLGTLTHRWTEGQTVEP